MSPKLVSCMHRWRAFWNDGARRCRVRKRVVLACNESIQDTETKHERNVSQLPVSDRHGARKRGGRQSR
eukprot:1365536-Rhodomonas_salina.1